MAPGVSDEVWQRLDPRAGVLSRRTRVRMWVAFAVALVMLVAGTLVWRTGVVVPRLVWPAGPDAWELHRNGVARIHFTVSNAGWYPVTVLDVGGSAPGFELLRVDGGGPAEDDLPSPFPVTLRSGEGVAATLVYRVGDCDALPRGDWPITARVERPWGVMTVEVRDDADRRWQEQVVDLWCDPRAWSID